MSMTYVCPFTSLPLTQCMLMGEHHGLKIAFPSDLQDGFVITSCIMCAVMLSQIMMYLWLLAEGKVWETLLLRPAQRSEPCFDEWSKQKPLGRCIISFRYSISRGCFLTAALMISLKDLDV